MTQPSTVKFALEFPQGSILFMENDRPGVSGDVGAIYFQPRGAAEAFMVWGERKELFGKHAVTVAKDRETGAGGYSVVYEFGANGALADARLVSQAETVQGALATPETVQALNDALARGEIMLYGRQDTELSKVFNAASFPDGRLLVQLLNKNELYLGTPGNYEKVDAHLVAQGGNSMYYKTAAGEDIELPYGFGRPGRDDIPKFNGEELTYLPVEPGADPAKFGLALAPGVVHLDPFSQQLRTQKPSAPKKDAPKP